MLISIEKLKVNSKNANVMPDEIREKLKKNIQEQGGKYPPLIVREVEGGYRIIDGHNRKQALQELGYSEVNCEVWDVDDKTEMLLLATLNELKGTQDLVKRANLLQMITELGVDRNNLLKLIPEDDRRLDFVLSIVDGQKLSEITDDVSRKNVEVEAERSALVEKFVKEGIDSKRAEAMADIYSFKSYVPELKSDVEGKQVGKRPMMIFWFNSEEEFNLAVSYFEAENDKEPKTEKLLELIK